MIGGINSGDYMANIYKSATKWMYAYQKAKKIGLAKFFAQLRNKRVYLH